MVRLKFPKRTLVVLAGTFIIFGIALLVNAVMTAPTHGELTSHTLVSTTSPDGSTVPLRTNSYQLQIPVGYTQQAGTPIGPGLMDNKVFFGHTRTNMGSSKLAITLKSLPPEGLSGDSTYRLFVAQPDTYKLEAMVYGEQHIALATKQNTTTYEEVALCPYKQRLLTIALSSTTATSTEIHQDMEVLLSNISWKN